MLSEDASEFVWAIRLTEIRFELSSKSMSTRGDYRQEASEPRPSISRSRRSSAASSQSASSLVGFRSGVDRRLIALRKKLNQELGYTPAMYVLTDGETFVVP